MKRFSISLFIACLIACVALSSCEQKVQVESFVHEDGSIDRTIVLADADSARFIRNMFGIKASDGWETDAQPAIQSDPKQGRKYTISFRKSYASAELANSDLNRDVDTLFRIKSKFQRDFRWFYTYIRYSDTYGALNQFHQLSANDFFTEEDFAFINRLPSEGKAISKSDSLYLSRLNEKILDIFASRAIFEEYVKVLEDHMTNKSVEPRWMDSLRANKDRVFQTLLKDDKLAKDEEVLAAIARVLGIPIELTKDETTRLSAETAARISFMSDASEGKFIHSVQMPWNVVGSNADSVVQSRLFWRPPVIKFMLNDYTMYAESRKLNYWAIVVSAFIIGATIWVLARKRAA